jgi:hypothetical protein
MQVEADELIKKYESFKLLINLYLLNPGTLEKYIKEHLLNMTEKDIIVGYLKKRADYKSSNIEELVKQLF